MTDPQGAAPRSLQAFIDGLDLGRVLFRGECWLALSGHFLKRLAMLDAPGEPLGKRLRVTHRKREPIATRVNEWRHAFDVGDEHRGTRALRDSSNTMVAFSCQRLGSAMTSRWR